ncbi:hypothetical protein [Aphanothece hegewaldii]|uniref:hypothetical protein n=1 Tax=Aphanothece hegewaldii TaxID=1521625 RepID=UPI0015E70033|nr:hypothetical protein [Aphanothece hegewaldii]
MKQSIEFTNLQQSYYNELIKVGVCPQKAEQAAMSMSSEELMMIAEIWIQWAVVLDKG